MGPSLQADNILLADELNVFDFTENELAEDLMDLDVERDQVKANHDHCLRMDG